MPKFLTALCLLVLLSACGQTGALYLPDHGKPPARHKDKPAKVVQVKPSAPADEPARPDTAAAPVSDGSVAPAPDDTPPSAPTPTP